MNETFNIPEDELQWTYVRAGGPGGQNVNKVASKAVLRWNLDASPSVPEPVKARLRTLQRRRITGEGELVLTSQRFRDQDRNRQDCLEKLHEMLREAAHVPKVRRATKPHRGAHAARLREKKRRSAVKSQRRGPADE